MEGEAEEVEEEGMDRPVAGAEEGAVEVVVVGAEADRRRTFHRYHHPLFHLWYHHPCRRNTEHTHYHNRRDVVHILLTHLVTVCIDH